MMSAAVCREAFMLPLYSETMRISSMIPRPSLEPSSCERRREGGRRGGEGRGEREGGREGGKEVREGRKEGRE